MGIEVDSIETQIALARLEEQTKGHITQTAIRFDRLEGTVQSIASDVKTLLILRERQKAQKMLVMKVVAVAAPAAAVLHQLWVWATDWLKGVTH